MKRVWTIVWMLVVALGLVGVAHAQGQEQVIIFDGTVVDAQGQPGVGRLVVVFLNGREVGRDEAVCSDNVCRFEVVIMDNSGLGTLENDGLTYVHVKDLKVGVPQIFQGPTPPRNTRSNYAVMALDETIDQLPESAKQGRLAIYPDGGLAVFEPTRPPDLPRPQPRTAATPASAVALPNQATPVPIVLIALLALTCCGSLVGLLALGGLVVYLFRTRPAASSPVHYE